MALRIEWHPAALAEVEELGRPIQGRIRKALKDLSTLDDAKQRLVPYTATLKGYWKFRVGDYRLICEIIERDGQIVAIVHVVHRSEAYKPKSIRTVVKRSK